MCICVTIARLRSAACSTGEGGDREMRGGGEEDNSTSINFRHRLRQVSRAPPPRDSPRDPLHYILIDQWFSVAEYRGSGCRLGAQVDSHVLLKLTFSNFIQLFG